MKTNRGIAEFYKQAISLPPDDQKTQKDFYMAAVMEFNNADQEINRLNKAKKRIMI